MADPKAEDDKWQDSEDAPCFFCGNRPCFRMETIRLEDTGENIREPVCDKCVQDNLNNTGYD